MRDPQASRAYAWEWACEAGHGRSQLAAGTCKSIIKWACHLYGVHSPEVQVSDSPKAQASKYLPDDDRIFLASRHRTPFLCLHEASHAIVHKYYGETVHDHGPEWLGVYCYLICKLQLAQPTYLRQSLRYMGLRALPTAAAQPRALRKRAKKKARTRRA